jgi:hypothetical protein
MADKIVWYDQLIQDIGFKAMWKQLSHDTQCIVIEHLNKNGRISDEQYEAFYLSDSFDFVPIYLPETRNYIGDQFRRVRASIPNRYHDAPGVDGKIFELTFKDAWGQGKLDILTGDNVAKPFNFNVTNKSFFDQEEKQIQSERIMKEAAEQILYYTPTIDEFHVGFEYEFHGMTTGGLMFLNGDEETKKLERPPHIKVWDKEIVCNPLPTDKMYSREYQMDDGSMGTITYADSEFMFHRSLKEIAEIISRGQIRVKKLDQDDILSLDFLFKGRTVLDWYELPNRIEDNWNSYGYWNKVQLLHDRVKGKVKVVAFEFAEDKDENVLFQGDCKNKSELIRVLKQIGYENNTEGTK